MHYLKPEQVKGSAMGVSEEFTKAPSSATARYLESTTLHGLPEVYNAASKLIRSLWVVVILLALAALVSQLTTVTTAYVKDDFGTKEKTWMPENIPPTILCPQFRYLEGPGITDHVADYILGYFPMSQFLNELITYGTMKTIPEEIREEVRKESKKMLASYGNSKKALVEALMPAGKGRYIKEGLSIVVGDVNVSTFVSFQGGCYLASLTNDQITAQSSAIALYTLDVNTSMEGQVPLGVVYTLFVGNRENNGAFSGYKDAVEIHGNFNYMVKLRATRRVGYPGRKKDRCKWYTNSDYVYCVAKWMDENVPNQGRAKGCITGTLPSVNFREEIVPRGNQTYCNFFDHLTDGFGFSIRNNRKLQTAAERACLPACVETVYDLQVKGTRRRRNEKGTSKITIAMDVPAYSKMVTEYPLVNSVDYLAALGGTFGLYFGASILSFVQIMFACVEAALGNRARRKLMKSNHEEKGNPYRNISVMPEGRIQP